MSPLPATLPFDPLGRVGFMDQSSLVFPEPKEGHFNFSDAPYRGLGGRSFDMEATTGVTVVRVTFTDGLESQWDVLVDPASPRFTLPSVPALRDRLFQNGNKVTGRRSRMEVKTFRREITDTFAETLEQNPAASPPRLSAWSQVQTRPMVIAFRDVLPNAQLGRQAIVQVEVEGFRQGWLPEDDGLVQLTVTGCGSVTSTTGALTLPFACRGQDLVMRAELLDSDGLPLVPSVAVSQTVTIQP